LADRIYRMNLQTVTSAERLRELLRGMKRGDPTAFQLARNGRLRFVVAEILGPAGNVAPPPSRQQRRQPNLCRMSLIAPFSRFHRAQADTMDRVVYTCA